MGALTQAERYLLGEIRQGRGEAWSQLVERYQGRLVAFARRKLPRSEDAEDVVQETFISFLNALTRFREEASLETYLFAILRRKIINWTRGKSTTICLLQDVMQADEGGDSGAASGRLVAPEETASWYARRDEEHALHGAALAAALRAVIEGYRQGLAFRELQIVELLFYGQLRNKDIADITGVSANHVAVTKHRCLSAICEQVARELRARSRSTAGADPDGAPPFDLPDALLTEVWQEQRLSCPKRSTIGAYLLGTLDKPWNDYVAFHLDRLGCRYCRANLEDLEEKTTEDASQSLRNRIMESTVGFLSRPGT